MHTIYILHETCLLFCLTICNKFLLHVSMHSGKNDTCIHLDTIPQCDWRTDWTHRLATVNNKCLACWHATRMCCRCILWDRTKDMFYVEWISYRLKLQARGACMLCAFDQTCAISWLHSAAGGSLTCTTISWSCNNRPIAHAQSCIIRGCFGAACSDCFSLSTAVIGCCLITCA